MNQILKWLSNGDLRSDGMAAEVADLVLENVEIFEDLFEGISNSNNVIRARTADALEKIARERPELIKDHIDELINIVRIDEVAMVRMHLAMLFGHMLAIDGYFDRMKEILLYLLEDKSVFTISWTIVSLCILARKYPQSNNEIVERISPLQGSSSIAIRSKIKKAMKLLLNSEELFPKGWIKSSHLHHL